MSVLTAAGFTQSVCCNCSADACCCWLAGKSKSVEITAADEAAEKAPRGPSKTKAKKVPRYVKEALKEVEQEKASRMAAAQLRRKADQHKAKVTLPAATIAAAVPGAVKQAAAVKK